MSCRHILHIQPAPCVITTIFTSFFPLLHLLHIKSGTYFPIILQNYYRFNYGIACIQVRLYPTDAVLSFNSLRRAVGYVDIESTMCLPTLQYEPEWLEIYKGLGQV